jgi:hypothetical protein
MPERDADDDRHDHLDVQHFVDRFLHDGSCDVDELNGLPRCASCERIVVTPVHGIRPRQDDEFRNTGKGNRTSLSPCFSCRTVAAAASISQGRCQLDAGLDALILMGFLALHQMCRPGFRKSGQGLSGNPESIVAAASG